MINWQQPGRPILLASQSPRRKQILSLMGLAFTTASPFELDESSYIDPLNLESSLVNLACAKAEVTARENPGALVLGADTIVLCNSRILGKPESRDHAKSMLASLSGISHEVLTSTALLCKAAKFKRTAVTSTRVTFRELHPDEIEGYLDSLEYKDKAGAYAIQGKAMIFIDKIDGCYYNVVGLPVQETIAHFKEYTQSGALHV